MNELTRSQQTAVTASAKRSPASVAETTFRDLMSRTILDKNGNAPIAFRAGLSPSSDEILEVMAKASGIRAGLAARADDRDAEKAVRLLFGGLKSPSGMDIQGMVAAYAIALDGVSQQALNIAVRNLLTGKAPEGFSRTFAPAAPELVSYVGWIERDIEARATTIERMCTLPEEVVREPISEADISARLEQIQKAAKAARQMDASKPMGGGKPTPGYAARVHDETAARRQEREEG